MSEERNEKNKKQKKDAWNLRGCGVLIISYNDSRCFGKPAHRSMIFVFCVFANLECIWAKTDVEIKRMVLDGNKRRLSGLGYHSIH